MSEPKHFDLRIVPKVLEMLEQIGSTMQEDDFRSVNDLINRFIIEGIVNWAEDQHDDPDASERARNLAEAVMEWANGLEDWVVVTKGN
ncbi:MAG: hypothetical protein JO289_06560 [Xanthobacteraceae bacterium]|nr:hypothetical protein [Xanthobacteraceae bacterium]